MRARHFGDSDWPTRLATGAGPRLVALDIDGTTVHHDGTLTTRTREAVAATAAAGHHVVIATGRSVLGALPVLADLGLQRGYAVCSNGAVTIALDPRIPDGYRVLRTETFDPGPVLHRLRAAWPGAQIAVEVLGRGFDVCSDFGPGELEGEIRIVDSWEELASRPATRVTFRSPTGTAQDFVEMAQRLGLHGVNYAVGFTAWMDIAAEGVSKASALERVRSRLGIAKRRTLAVGDQRNDLEMLSWAACGVAMGNAPDEVKAVSDLVTGHVQQDGLATVLELLAEPAGTASARLSGLPPVGAAAQADVSYVTSA
ncbi:MAG: HAD family hydrolase [Austwickia sp.]|nr:HAD family hydrolase [Austwickia sp.]MBK8437085.1 HAD family hydrolase [Austwickia sp.]MBK9102320.1 HAD family hydrolase [Austwickia sp.]